MTDQEHSSQGELKIVGSIRREFERVEREAREPAKPGRGSARRRPRVAAVALVGGLLAAGVAGAATGLLPGDIIPAGQDPEGNEHPAAGDQTVLASGVSPVAGPWRLTSLKKEAIGEEPAGDCLQLLLTNPPADVVGVGGTLLCQRVGKSEFKADSVPVVNSATGKAETLLFGTAPEAASSVELTADGDTSPAEHKQGPSDFPGDAWVVVVPSGKKTGELKSMDANGKTQAKLDASTYFDQLATWERSVASSK
jgi:hypothetical protein